MSDLLRNSDTARGARILRADASWPASIAVIAILSMAVMLGCSSAPRASDPPATPALEPLSPCDDHAFRHMFKGKVYAYPPAPWRLIPTYTSLYGADLDSAHGQCLTRWYHLYQSFNQLMAEDAIFKRRFEEVEAHVVSELGQRPSSFAVRTVTYQSLYDLGMLHELVSHADASASTKPTGPLPPSLAQIPHDAGKGDAGVTASLPRAESSKKCSRIFYYCASARQIRMSHFGDPQLESCLANLRRLRISDPEFRDLFSLAVQALNQRAKEVDPADSRQILKLQMEVFEAMERTGISQRISGNQ